MTVIAAFVFVVAIISVSALLEGWVLSLLWGWFLVPLGASALSIPAAIGLALIAGMLTHQASSSRQVEWVDTLERALVIPFLALFIGWIVKQFL